MRVIDFLQSLPDVDAERIAVTGASGGGTQTFLVSAVDPRVKVAAPVNMISAIMQGGACESAPGLRLGTFNVEIGALMAPRPLLMVSASAEWPGKVLREEGGRRIVLGRAGKGDRVPAFWATGKGSAALVVHPEGSAAGQETPESQEWIRSGRPLLAIDAYQTGRAVEPREA